jgi:cytochrome c
MKLTVALVGVSIVTCMQVISGCTQHDALRDRAVALTGGDAHRGADVVRTYRCGSCHDIPGVRGADGTVGPPLANLLRRGFIAGELPNTPENLVRWIKNPPAVRPNTAMPMLGLSEQQARDVAAYLYSS